MLADRHWDAVVGAINVKPLVPCTSLASFSAVAGQPLPLSLIFVHGVLSHFGRAGSHT